MLQEAAFEGISDFELERDSLFDVVTECRVVRWLLCKQLIWFVKAQQIVIAHSGDQSRSIQSNARTLFVAAVQDGICGCSSRRRKSWRSCSTPTTSPVRPTSSCCAMPSQVRVLPVQCR